MNENPQTPEEVGQWLRDHGGPVRSEGPDANGIVTQHAADGSYLRQQALPGENTRVLEVKPAGPATPGGDGSAPATTAPRGAGMDQKQLEALLAQMGPLGPGDFREEVKTEDVPNPKYDASDPANNQLTIKQPVTYRTWVKPGTNQRLTVKVNPDGSYTQTFSGADAGINPSKPNENVPQPPKEEPNPNNPTRMRRWNPKANNGQGGWEDAGPNAAVDKTGKPTGNTRTTSKNGQTVKETEYQLPDGSKEWRSQTETGEPDRVGKPTGNTRQRTENGQTTKEIEYVLPDGTKEWRSQTAPDSSNAPLPADMPPFKPDINKPGLGVIEYVQQLTALRSAGKLTDRQYTEFVGHAHSQATSEAQRLDTIQRAQQQLQANEISQRNADQNASVSRLNAANTATQNALDTSQKMAGNFTPGTLKGAGPILPAVMALQDMRAGAWGGMNQPAPIGASQYPLLNQVGQMGAGNPNTVIPAVADLGAQAAAATATTNQQITRLTQSPAAPAGPVTPAFTPQPVAPAPVQGAAPAPAPVFVPPPPVVMNPPSGDAQVPSMPASAPIPGLPPGTSIMPQPPVPAVDPNAPNGSWPAPPAQPGAPTWETYRPAPSPLPPNEVTMAPQQPGILPAVNGLGILAEVGASGKYPQDVLEQAARELGLM